VTEIEGHKDWDSGLKPIQILADELQIGGHEDEQRC
jgi:hypothetical protein